MYVAIPAGTVLAAHLARLRRSAAPFEWLAAVERWPCSPACEVATWRGCACESGSSPVVGTALSSKLAEYRVPAASVERDLMKACGAVLVAA